MNEFQWQMRAQITVLKKAVTETVKELWIYRHSQRKGSISEEIGDGSGELQFYESIIG